MFFIWLLVKVKLKLFIILFDKRLLNFLFFFLNFLILFLICDNTKRLAKISSYASLL